MHIFYPTLSQSPQTLWFEPSTLEPRDPDADLRFQVWSCWRHTRSRLQTLVIKQSKHLRPKQWKLQQQTRSVMLPKSEVWSRRKMALHLLHKRHKDNYLNIFTGCKQPLIQAVNSRDTTDTQPPASLPVNVSFRSLRWQQMSCSVVTQITHVQ